MVMVMEKGNGCQSRMVQHWNLGRIRPLPAYSLLALIIIITIFTTITITIITIIKIQSPLIHTNNTFLLISIGAFIHDHRVPCLLQLKERR